MAALGSAANTIETGESDVVRTSAYAGAAMQVELGDQLEIFHGDEWHAAVVVGQGRNRIQMEATANGRFESFDVPQDRAAYFLRAPQLPAASRPRESYLEGRGAFAPDGSIRPDLSADLHEILRLQSQLACHNAHYMKVIRDLMWQKELAMFLYRQNNVFSGGTLPETDTLAILLRINYGLSAAEADELVIHLPQEVGTTFVTSSTEPQRTSRLLRFMRNGEQELFAHTQMPSMKMCLVRLTRTALIFQSTKSTDMQVEMQLEFWILHTVKPGIVATIRPSVFSSLGHTFVQLLKQIMMRLASTRMCISA